MRISGLTDKLNLKLLTNKDYEDREVSGCYIGDLLSWVISRAESDNVWITVQTNINIIAVATLADVSCVIIPDGIDVEQTTLDKANEKGVVVLGSPDDSYTLAVGISRLL